MDKTFRPFVFLLILVLPLVALVGCDSNPLEESPRSVVTPEQFYQTEEEFRAALAPVYAQLRDVAQWDIYDLQEHSSDEVMVPTRGGDWGDGGIWRDLTQHRWDATHPAVGGGWGIAFTGVARSNSVLASLNATETELEGVDQFIAELRFLRAFYYYHLMDLYGNVPVVVEEGGEYDQDYPTQPVPADDPPEQRSRSEVFSFILQELTGCSLESFDVGCVTDPGGAIAEMPAKGAVDYGRATQGAGYALLARLLINGQVYSGTVADLPQGGQTFWEEASAAAQQVINSGDYMLEDDYFANFTVDNQGSSESIFVAAYKNEDPLGWQKQMAFLHYNQLPQTPWNGFTTIADFYSSFEVEPGDDGELGTRDDVKNDDRARQFLAGQMYQEPSEGCQADECWSDEASGKLLDRSDRDLRFTLEIPSIQMGSGNSEIERAGIRPLKWEIDADRDAVHMGNDFPIIRLAEMYLIWAEAENEQGNAGEAVDIINTYLRDRANAPDYTGPADQATVRSVILQERGYELHTEGLRRQDLIRYEVSGGSSSDDPYAPTFTGEWLFKDASDGFRMVFPIPQSQLDANPKLAQNPGYGG